MPRNNYTLIKLSKKLEDFLRRKGILSKFKRNIMTFRSTKRIKGEEFDSMRKAFQWIHTDEGMHYWFKINKEFENE